MMMPRKPPTLVVLQPMYSTALALPRAAATLIFDDPAELGVRFARALQDGAREIRRRSGAKSFGRSGRS